MKKICVALLACCLTLSGTIALAQGTMNSGTTDKSGMSMEKAMPADSMSKGAMKKETMDKDMTKMDAQPKHAAKHQKPGTAMRPGAMEDKKQDSMQRMQ